MSVDDKIPTTLFPKAFPNTVFIRKPNKGKRNMSGANFSMFILFPVLPLKIL